MSNILDKRICKDYQVAIGIQLMLTNRHLVDRHSKIGNRDFEIIRFIAIYRVHKNHTGSFWQKQSHLFEIKSTTLRCQHLYKGMNQDTGSTTPLRKMKLDDSRDYNTKITCFDLLHELVKSIVSRRVNWTSYF